LSAQVDLTGQLSNPDVRLRRMLASASPQVRPSDGPPSAESGSRQKQVRLSDGQQVELVERYEAGAFKKELARVDGIHVETVRAIIRRRAVVA
jgi:DNA-directed RNA polymerase specialized sigma24 family protein